MKIYTKTGDEGTTGLFGGARVAKDDPRVEAYGTVDELNAAVGVCRAAGLESEVDAVLHRVQVDLFTLGAELAVVAGKEGKLRMELVGAREIARLEEAIDAAEALLTPLQSFVLPGGTPAAAALHAARTSCRRAERRVLTARASTPLRNEPIVYLNRLSDLLFVLARRQNAAAGVADVPWRPRDDT